MGSEIIKDLRSFLDILKSEGELHVIDIEVDPHLEIAEIHRRVINRQGPALFFSNVKGSRFPVVTNLFGTAHRLELAFGKRPQKFVADLVKSAETMVPPTLGGLWGMRDLFGQALKIGLKKVKNGPILEKHISPPRLTELPMLTSWSTDGGPFVTLPLVYTEHPEGLGHNLGMYRIQRHSESTTGIHWQIHKGGGNHYFEAERLNKPLPLTLYIGGPPALMMAAIAPLPENIPELMLASLLIGGKLEMTRAAGVVHPLVANAEFAVHGIVPPHLRKPEGPFGDHYGYNSLTHDYPVFQVSQLFHRKNAIYPATVVGRPRQEDYYIGDFLQELLSPLFPLVMSGVKQLKTFGDTGFHALAAARVFNRYPREAFASGLRILGEGQLSLSKFLLITDGDIDVNDFPKLWTHILERVNWQTDLFVFANVSQDTLDYTGPAVNNGSKAMLLGLGKEPQRDLPNSFEGELPRGCGVAKVFLPGTLVVEGPSFADEQDFPKRLKESIALKVWPVVLLVDNTKAATKNLKEFLWSFFTRFEPAADIHGAEHTVHRFHMGLKPPIIFDCRMKPWYPHILEVDSATKKKVDEKIGGMLPAKWR